MDKIKAKFFALYLGQEVYTDNGFELNSTLLTAMYNNPEKERHLLLRDISQLTDDELIQLDNLYHATIPLLYYKKIEYGRAIVSGISTDIETGVLRYSRVFMFQDYLRSIGILLPFTYLDDNNKPITMQPDELIKLGWVVIKK